MSGTAGHQHLPKHANPASRRLLLIRVLAFIIAIGAALLADVLVALIGLITNIAFYGPLSLAFTSPPRTTSASGSSSSPPSAGTAFPR